MIVAIIDQTVPVGVIAVQQFQVAVDVATAINDYVNAFNPPLNPADWLGFDTGWATPQDPPGGANYEWAYNFGSLALEEKFFLPDLPDDPCLIHTRWDAADYASAFNNYRCRNINAGASFGHTAFLPNDFGALLGFFVRFIPNGANPAAQATFNVEWGTQDEALNAHSAGPLVVPYNAVGSRLTDLNLSMLFAAGPLLPNTSIGLFITNGAGGPTMSVLGTYVLYLKAA